MLKKIGKRVLSVVLTLVLIATTFFIFDPGVLVPETNAVVDVSKLVNTVEPTVKFYVPEAIYLHPVKNTTAPYYNFQYYIDCDDSGTLHRSATQTTGSVFFSCSAACSSINISWESGTTVTATTESTNQTVKQTITGGKTSQVDGRVKVTCTYVVEGRTYYAYAYTYMYYPDLDLLTGIAGTYVYKTSIGNEPKLAAFSFLTGVHYVGSTTIYNDGERGVSNYYDQDTVMSSKGKFGLSPLVPGWSSTAEFKKANDDAIITDNTTIYGETTSTCKFIEQGKGGVYYLGRQRDDSTNKAIGSVTTSWGKVFVDTSRVTNYNQIPNLRTGFICHFYSSSGDAGRLDSFKSSDGTITSITNIDYRNGDGKGYGMTPEYALAGVPKSGTYVMQAHYKFERSNSSGVNFTQRFGLKVETVNKSTLRSAYRAAIENSFQATTASVKGWSSSVQTSWTSAYNTYVTAFETAGTILGKPYATATEVTNAATALTNATTALENIAEANFKGGTNDALIPQVKFYVPETIYINTSNGTGSQYLYGVDESGNASPVALSSATNAKIYFAGVNCNPTSVKITCAASGTDNSTTWSNVSASTLSNITFGGEYFTGTNANSTGKTYTSFPVNTNCSSVNFGTAIATGAARFIRWRADFVVDGITFTTYAYTICYRAQLYEAKFRHGTRAHTKSNSYPAFINARLTVSGLNVSGFDEEDGPDGKGNRGSGSSNNGSSETREVSYIVDTSRFNNYNQLPYFNATYTYSAYEGNQDGTYAEAYNEKSTGTKSAINQDVSNSINIAINPSEKLVVFLHAQQNYKSKVAQNYTYINIKPIANNKSSVRTTYHNAVSTCRQQNWYSSGWDTYQNSIVSLAVAANHPTNTETSRSANTDVLTLKSGGTVTAVHMRDGETPDYNGNKNQAIIGTETESKGYSYGDKVYGYYNDIPGFTKSRYSVTDGTNTWTSGIPQDSKHNNYYYIRNANTDKISWTFWYTPNTYTVKYDPDGGTFSDNTTGVKTYANSATYQSKYYVGGTAGDTPAAPTRIGCTFLGWKCSADGITYQPGEAINWEYAQDVTFTAVWDFNSYYTFYNENHDGLAANILSTNYGSDVATASEEAEEGLNVSLVEGMDNALRVNGSTAGSYVIDLLSIDEYGQSDAFRFEAGKTYTLSVDVISGAIISGTGVIDLVKENGAALSTRVNLDFNSADMSKTITITETLAEEIKGIKIWIYTTGTATLNDYTFIPRVEESTARTESAFFADYLAYGGKYEALPTPTRTGYTFMGWYTAPQGGEKVDVGSPIQPKDITLYAHWSAYPYTVQFNGNGKTSGTMANQEFTYDESQKLNANQFKNERFVNYYDGDTKLTIDAAYTTASAEFKGWSLTENGTMEFEDKQSVINLTTEKNKVVDLYALWSSKYTDVTVAGYSGKSGYTLIGWTKTKGSVDVDYIPGQSVKYIKDDVNLYAVWHENVVDDQAKMDEKLENIFEIFKGYGSNGDEITETVPRWKDDVYNAYVAATDAFIKAQNRFNIAKSTANATTYAEKEIALKEAVEVLNRTESERSVDKYYIEHFFVKSDTENGEHNVAEINLNKYATQTLIDIKNAYTSAIAVPSSAKISEMQGKLNEYVSSLALWFDEKTAIPTTPSYTLYDSAESIKEQLEKSGLGVNYVMKSGGSTTYYCYTNKANPTVYLTVDVAATNGRACYPTRSTLTQENVENILGKTSAVTTGGTLETRDVTSTYSEYLNAGLGTTYSEDINGTAYTGTDYYNKQSLIKLAPEFTEGKDGAVKYTIVSEDDSLTPNKATKTKSSAALDNTLKAISDDNGSTLTIVIDYHTGAADADGKMVPIYAWGAQTSEDVWLKQYHIFRSAQGARNWELPQANAKTDGKTQYIVNDDTYGQSDRGSFTFTFELASTNDIANGKLNTTNVDEIIGILQNSGSYNAAVEKTFIGTNKDGDGLGYQKWGTNWSFNYYPKSGAYTYVHLVDRWGNTCDDVFCVGNQDSFPIQSAKVNTLTEKGGSGISTLSLDAEIELIADENSVIDGEVYKTTGNTVRFKTPAANKSYTLTMTDKATNQSTATLTSDENGIVSLNVEDEAYSGGVYTFTLNGKEINLYAELEKRHVISVENGTAYTGSSATAKIITDGSVSKVRLIDKNGNTITNNSCVRNADGTKTWQFTRKMSEGEYSYSISTKVGEKWGSETATVSFKFTKKAPATGKLMSAEYEDGLYKLTLEGKGTKVQFTDRIGLTRTYSRSNSNVKKVVENGDGTEVWYVKTKLIKGAKYTVAAKFNAGWNRTDTVTITAE